MPQARAVLRNWKQRLIRNLAQGQIATVGGVTVTRSIAPLAAVDSRPPARHLLGRPRVERSDLLAEWTRSGELSCGEAEALMALDETTSWRA